MNNIEILEKSVKKNMLMHRDEIILKVKVDKISREEAKEIIAKNFNVNKELVVVNKIKSNFGKNIWDIDAFVYENEKYLNIFGKNEKKKKEQEAK
jgi:ribosomal protein S24E